MSTPKGRRKGKVAGDKSDIVAELPAACADEALAVEFMERQRWGDCPCCPRCGDTNVRKMMGKDGKRNARFLWRCYGCKKQFTVRINTVYEDSRIPLRHWVFAFWAACASKKGVSALQIKRQTGLNYRSALFLMHRIRYAMTPSPDSPEPLRGMVEADEVYIGGTPKGPPWVKNSPPNREKWSKKTPVVALVERRGDVRAWPVANVTGDTLRKILRENVRPGSAVVTDGKSAYRAAVAGAGATHRVIRHDLGEYVRRDDRRIHTNTVEGFFSLLRKRIDGTHHAVSKEHLHRYVNEAAFVYNNRDCDDGERTVRAIRAANCKRLTYREPIKRAKTA